MSQLQAHDQRAGPVALRYQALDGYRGVAALLVMLYHYNTDFGLGLERWSGAVSRLHLLVDFFFVLSGFVIMASYGDRVGSWQAYITFLRRRLARLYPLHALTLLAFIGLGAVTLAGLVTANHPEDFAFSALPANLALVQGWGVVGHPSFNVPAWSISAEWFVYLCFPALAFMARRWPVPASLATLANFIVLLAIIRDAAGREGWTHMTFDGGAFRAVPSFFAGVLVASLVPSIAAGRHIGFVTWRVVHALFAVALVLMHVGAPAELILATFVAVVGAAALAEHAGRPTRLTSPLAQRLGASSYGIYMLHVLAAIPVLFLRRWVGGLSTMDGALTACVTAIVVVLAADLLHRRFERPWQRRLNGRRLRPEGGKRTSSARPAALNVEA